MLDNPAVAVEPKDVHPGIIVIAGPLLMTVEDDEVTLGDWDGDGDDTAAVLRNGVPVANAPSTTDARIVAHYGFMETPDIVAILGGLNVIAGELDR